VGVSDVAVPRRRSAPATTLRWPDIQLPVSALAKGLDWPSPVARRQFRHRAFARGMIEGKTACVFGAGGSGSMSADSAPHLACGSFGTRPDSSPTLRALASRGSASSAASADLDRFLPDSYLARSAANGSRKPPAFRQGPLGLDEKGQHPGQLSRAARSSERTRREALDQGRFPARASLYHMSAIRVTCLRPRLWSIRWAIIRTSREPATTSATLRRFCFFDNLRS